MVDFHFAQSNILTLKEGMTQNEETANCLVLVGLLELRFIEITLFLNSVQYYYIMKDM